MQFGQFGRFVDFPQARNLRWRHNDGHAHRADHFALPRAERLGGGGLTFANLLRDSRERKAELLCIKVAVRTTASRSPSPPAFSQGTAHSFWCVRSTNSSAWQPRNQNASFHVGDKIGVNLHRGKIEDAVGRAVIQDEDGIKLHVDVVGLDLTALIDTRQVVD